MTAYANASRESLVAVAEAAEKALVELRCWCALPQELERLVPLLTAARSSHSCSLCHDDGLTCPACNGEGERDRLREALTLAVTFIDGEQLQHALVMPGTSEVTLIEYLRAALAGKEPR